MQEAIEKTKRTIEEVSERLTGPEYREYLDEMIDDMQMRRDAAAEG